MKRLALIFTLLQASFSMQGQTFYELQFTHPVDGKKYLGLMTYFSDERCKMRIVQIRPQHGGFIGLLIDRRGREIIVRVVKCRSVILTIGILASSGSGSVLSEEIERLELHRADDGFIEHGHFAVSCILSFRRCHAQRQQRDDLNENEKE